MKSKLSYLIKTNLKKKFTSKWFIIINVLLCIFIPILVNLDSLIKFFGGDFNEPTKIYIYADEDMYDAFEKNINKNSYLEAEIKMETQKGTKDKKELETEIKNDKKKDIIVTIKENDKVLSAEVISFEYINAIIYQTISNTLNNIKFNYSLVNSNIDLNELEKASEEMEIYRVFLTEKLDENEEIMNSIGGILIPVLIIPIFILVVMAVNMIGAEINEEKTSKSMEIIISSVSPLTHFASKIISSNIFIFSQGLLILIFGGLGVLIRFLLFKSNVTSILGIDNVSMINTFLQSETFINIVRSIPIVIILIILTFLAYTLIAGILASMTTSMEDYNQIQTPVMLIMMFAYYLAIIASVYDNSILIKIMSYIPLVSGILAPVLLILGQLSFIEIMIITVTLIITNFLLFKYGIKIYKVGILNYSSKDLWKKMFKAIKE